MIRAIPAVPGTRAAGACATVAGLLQLALGLTAGAFPLATSGFSPWMALSAVALLLLVAALGGLAAAEVAGSGRLAIVGLAVAIAGVVTDLLAHAIAAIDATRSVSPLFPVGAVGTWAGMVLTGAAVLLARRWAGRGRFLPLACGLYPVAAVLPAYLLGDGLTGHLAQAGLGLLWALLGVGLSRVRRSWLPPVAPTRLPLRLDRFDDPARRP
ncbi:hypothetical protein [Pseudonocardia humida]|uniref:Uncharacterized protein n=1 Tax=Pseudonocardia humida TaxID=2800819 RepID=A0ABT1A8Z4_9PSEU|nr:hypothetical protein [Pseudonocardia humida]MCO1659441.1 hypothetical protein [Pseudonocardia humida]